ncbi:DUF1850 domain-containing protein [Terasakiella pusilla]|uniref:DUF1850 domain-containing protein n=1 Tax=Terasakiella pusilla TaxID=64973 RepID=UPI00048FB0DD|nr:DUF1850 domain-containing protein [Terasakiella pusilla]
MKKALSSKLKLLFGAVAFMAAAPNVYGAALDITDSRSNEKLACVELAADEFALTFIHSVSLTPVEDIYKIYKVSPDAFAIRQLEERFITHGQGLPSMDGEPDAKRFVRQDGTFILYLDRPIHDLIVRLDSRFKNRLDVGSSVINLNQWPDFSGVRLAPRKDCH